MCGACTVLLDGEAVRSCLLFAVQADGAEVDDDRGPRRPPTATLSPVQEAFRAGARSAVRVLHARLRRVGAPRCSRENPHADRRRDPRGALGQPLPLHRLPGDRPRRAARPRGASASHEPRRTAGRFVGQSVKRREDPRLLTGHGRYVDDVDRCPGMLHCAFVRSDVARGRITRARRRGRARARRRVRGADRAPTSTRGAGSMQPTMLHGDRRPCAPLRPLADGDVRFVGEPIVLVVAESRYVAEDAAELVEVDDRAVEPAVVDVERGARRRRADRAPRARHEPRRGDGVPRSRPELDALLRRRGARRARARSASTGTRPCPMETRGIVVEYEPRERRAARVDRARRTRTRRSRRSRGSTGRARAPRARAGRAMSAAASGRSSSRRARSSTVALAARRLGRTLKWIEDRRENLIASNHARADVGARARSRSTPTAASSARTSTTSRTPARIPVGATGGAGPLVGDAVHRAVQVPDAACASTRRCGRTRAGGARTAARGCSRRSRASRWSTRPRARSASIRSSGGAATSCATDELPYTLPTGLPLDMVTPGGDARAGRRDHRLRRVPRRAARARSPTRAGCSASGSGSTSSRAPG